MATVVVLLWVVNALQLQPYEFELRTSIAISEHRVPALHNLVGQRGARSEVIRILECQIAGAKEGSLMAELRTAKIRARVANYACLSQVESWLESKTRPTETSESCRVLRNQLLQAKWHLESQRHVIQVLERDRERESEQAAINSSKTRAAFQLVGFQRSTSKLLESCPVISSLQERCHVCEDHIAQLTSKLELEQTKSLGFVRFTGAPKQYPVVECLGVRRGLALLALVGGIWAMIGIAITKLPASLHTWQTIVSLASKAMTQRTSTLDMPCLGEVVIEGWVFETSPPGTADKSESESDSKKLPQALRWFVMSGVGIWLLLAMSRFAFDAAWRQLFLAAPLAGLSHVLSGVP